MVIQLTMLDGMWSRKMSQSAIPRNRSSRRSRWDGTAGVGTAGGIEGGSHIGLKGRLTVAARKFQSEPRDVRTHGNLRTHDGISRIVLALAPGLLKAPDK